VQRVRSILDFIMRGRVHAIMATAAFALLAVGLAPFVYLSGAVVGLSTLRNGELQGVVIMAGASALYAVVCAAFFGNTVIALLMIVIVWAPTLLLCIGLRATSSQALTLTFGAMLAAAGVLVFHLVVGDTGQWWRQIFDQLVASGLSGLGAAPDRNAVVLLVKMLDAAAPMMAGLLAGAILSSAYVMTLLARWFHSVLDNPGGFGQEFRSLSLDYKVAIAVVVVAGLVWFSGDIFGGFARDILFLAVVLYLFQGLAVAHGVVAQLGASIGWLFFLYVVLIIATEHVLLLLTITGFLDTWLKIRTRLGNKPANS